MLYEAVECKSMPYGEHRGCKIRGKDHCQLVLVAVCAWGLRDTRKNGEKEPRQKAGAVVWEREGEFYV